MRVPEPIAATCVSLAYRVPERCSSKVAAFGLDVAFAAGVEILTSSPSVGTLDWRGPLTNVRFTPESGHQLSALECPLLCQKRTFAAQSITSSERACSVAGMGIFKLCAALRLITSSNVVGCMTGGSAGLSPLRMRPA